VRALVKAQAALRQDVAQASAIGRRLFPAAEAELIGELVRRDLPYYDAAISPRSVAGMNRFARGLGLLADDAPYERVVATRFGDLWARTAFSAMR
jgi:ABC-type nitrate/sulfonate/bicarbonate transport system substrate-binding protein